jgi:hypothetical protein
MITHHSQDGGTAFHREHHPEVPADTKLEMFRRQSTETEPGVSMWPTKCRRKQTQRLIQAVELVPGKRVGFALETRGKLNL